MNEIKLDWIEEYSSLTTHLPIQIFLILKNWHTKENLLLYSVVRTYAEAEDMKRFREDVLVDHADQLKELRELLNQQTVKAEINSLQRKWLLFFLFSFLFVAPYFLFLIYSFPTLNIVNKIWLHSLFVFLLIYLFTHYLFLLFVFYSLFVS